MKLIVNHLGKIVIALVITSLSLTLLFGILVPALRDNVPSMLPDERNYVVNETGEGKPTLTSSAESVTVSVNAYLNIFSRITALSCDGENIISQLKDDYARPLNERTKVFVYEVTHGPRVLANEINTSYPSKWVVFYILDDGDYVNTLSVTYNVE